MPHRGRESVAASAVTAERAVAAFWQRTPLAGSAIAAWPQTWACPRWRAARDAAAAALSNADAHQFAALCVLVASGILPQHLWGKLPYEVAARIASGAAANNPHLKATVVSALAGAEPATYQIALWRPGGSQLVAAAIAGVSSRWGCLEEGAEADLSAARCIWYYCPPGGSWYAIWAEYVTPATPAERVARRCRAIEAALAPFPVAFILSRRRPRPDSPGPAAAAAAAVAEQRKPPSPGPERPPFSFKEPITIYDAASSPYVPDLDLL